MPPNSLVTRHGRLLSVVGTPCRAGGVAICPALVEIDVPTPCHPLTDFHRPAFQAFGAFEYPDEADLPDALWVRGRLPGLFGYRPLQVADGRLNLLDAGFVAVLPGSGGLVACPFAVTDDSCGFTRLVVSSREHPAITLRVAAEFWGLLATRGIDEDFRAEGLAWDTAFDSEGEWTEEVLGEVGRWRGTYYSESVAHDHHFDPDAGRPDYSMHRYRCRPSEPQGTVRHCW